MTIDLTKAVVVITGASSGIGQATAEAFAREGSRLVIAARNGDALEAVAQSCRRIGSDVLVVPTDVTDAEAVRALASKAAAFGGIDIWVSNVGTGAVGRFHETPIEAHRRVIDANLIGHMNDAHAVVPIFLKQGHGIFINMISLGGFAAAPFAAAYSASKFGLRGFTEALRAELADQPAIHICDIYPAFVDTPGISHGANYVGRKLGAPPPVLDARRVAARIVDIARRPRATTMVGSVAGAARLAHLLAPNASGRLVAKFMASYFRRAKRVPTSDGILFRPSETPDGIDGGLRSLPVSRASSATIAVAALVAMTAGAMVADRYLRHRSRPRQYWPTGRR